MIIDISKIDPADFKIKESIVAEETCYLIGPQAIGTKWNEDNLHLRSVIVNEAGDIISASFPKFFNWDEKPELTGKPKNIEDCKILEKLDGSTLILSKYKGNFILRTRGTFDAYQLDNGYEIDEIIQKYPMILYHNNSETWEYSLLFEWLSPTNRIVIKHNEVDIRLIGGISHETYGLFSQSYLDHIASKIGVKRPKYWVFADFDDMKKTIESLKDEEGICVYYNSDSNIRKVKASEYLRKHALKSELGSLKRKFEYWSHLNFPSSEEFYSIVESEIDFETAEEIKEASLEFDINHKWFNLENIAIINMLEFEGPWETRKEFALEVNKRIDPLMKAFAFKYGDHIWTFKDGEMIGDLELFKEMKTKVLKNKLGL